MSWPPLSPLLFLAVLWAAIGFCGYLILQVFAEILAGVNKITVRKLLWISTLAAVFIALLKYHEGIKDRSGKRVGNVLPEVVVRGTS